MASISGPAATWQCRPLAENASTFPVWQVIRALARPLYFSFSRFGFAWQGLIASTLWPGWPALPCQGAFAGFGAGGPGGTGREPLSEIKLRQSLDYEKHST